MREDLRDSFWVAPVLGLLLAGVLTKAAFAVFLATFVFALLALFGFSEVRDPRKVSSVPVVSCAVALLLVLVSLLLFIAYVHATLRLMRVTFVIDRVTRETLAVLDAHARQGFPDRPAELGDPVAEVIHSGPSGVLRAVSASRLTRIARRHDTALRLVPKIGDFIAPGTPVLTLHGSGRPPVRRLRSALHVGVERTFHQDLGFGLRQLCDIALRALSPAMNDPTTAVQSLDRIHQILATLAVRPLGEVHHRDRRGRVRLVQPLPDWPDLVDLALTEIRHSGHSAPQVTRRLRAALEDLLRITPEPRSGPLRHHLAQLTRAVERSAPDPDDREFALVADRQGIG